ncbi:MAG: cysteine hydrolase [Actinobacteria bacterium]|nr:cysteine hydrolase [Actinomycetota bacterium]
MFADEREVLDRYLRVFGLAPQDLIEDGTVSEADVVRNAWADYQRDRTDAFAIVAARSALVVVDMQVGFVRRSSPQWVPQAERMVPRLASFAGEARALGMPVLFTSAVFLDPSPTDALRMTVAIAEGNLAADTDALEIVPVLWRDGDQLVGGKHTYDAFRGTDLDYRLRALGRDTVVIAGTLTNVCCEATARVAFDKGYHVVMASDLCATDNPFAQEATLQTVRRSYGRVLTAEQVLAEAR